MSDSSMHLTGSSAQRSIWRSHVRSLWVHQDPGQTARAIQLIGLAIHTGIRLDIVPDLSGLCQAEDAYMYM